MKIVRTRVFPGPSAPVAKLVYSNSGRWLAGAGGSERTIFVWDSTTLDRKTSFVSSEQSVGLLMFSPDEQSLLFSGNLSDSFETWDAQSGQRMARSRILPDPYRRSVAGHLITATHISDAAISTDGNLIAVGCWDCTLKIIKRATGEWNELSHKSANVDFVAFNRLETRVISGTNERIFEWDATDWTLKRTIACDSSEHWTHHSIDQGDRIVSLSDHGQFLVWNTYDWTSEAYRIRGKGPPTCVAYSPRDGLLAIGRKDGSALFWDTTRRAEAGKLKLSDDHLSSMAFAPERSTIAVVRGSHEPVLIDYEH